MIVLIHLSIDVELFQISGTVGLFMFQRIKSAYGQQKGEPCSEDQGKFFPVPHKTSSEKSVLTEKGTFALDGELPVLSAHMTVKEKDIVRVVAVP